MNARIVRFVVLMAVMLVMHAAFSVAKADPSAPATDRNSQSGLLLIAHGSPRPEWNESVERVGGAVKSLNQESKVFHAVEMAFLECPEQDVAAGVVKLEQAGCDHIIAVPLFITPSSHTHFDVTAVLGLYSGDAIRAAMEEEGSRAAKPTVPITLTQTLDDSVLLDNFVLDQVRAFSSDPPHEAIVVVIHGDPEHQQLVDNVARRIATYACGKTGISYADWAYCGVGQTYMENGVPSILHAAEKRKRVLVAGLYLSITAEGLHKRGMALSPWGKKYDPIAEKDNIVFSTKRLTDAEGFPEWIMNTAEKALR